MILLDLSFFLKQYQEESFHFYYANNMRFTPF